jgi:hypothetical protein
MPIYSLENGVFDSEATALLGKAFEAACEELRFPKDKSVRELVAERVIAAARRGELDPLRLQSAAVVGFSRSGVDRKLTCPPDAYAISNST